MENARAGQTFEDEVLQIIDPVMIWSSETNSERFMIMHVQLASQTAMGSNHSGAKRKGERTAINGIFFSRFVGEQNGRSQWSFFFKPMNWEANAYVLLCF